MLIRGMIRVVNKVFRSQPPNMRVQCNPGHNPHAPQDATGNSEREAQQNGLYVSAREFVCHNPHFLL